MSSIRYGSGFISLHINTQLSQYYLLKRLTFLHRVFLALLSNAMVDHVCLDSWSCPIGLFVYFYASASNCSAEKRSWEPSGQQGDQTSQS